MSLLVALYTLWTKCVRSSCGLGAELREPRRGVAFTIHLEGAYT